MPLRSFARIAALLILTLLGSSASAAGLNDTGQLTCLDANAQWTTACAGSLMDAGTGRDRSKPANGDGVAGFSYTRVCNNGEDAGTGTCPARPAHGMADTKWGCTRDEVTGLLWELKDTRNGKSRRYVYGLYPTQAGYSSQPVNGMTISDYVAWANKQALCGRTDWRLPTVPEITSIMRFGGSDALNAVPTADTSKGFPDLQVLESGYLTVAIDGALNGDGNLAQAFFLPAGWAPGPTIESGAYQSGVRLVAGSQLSPSLRVQGVDGGEVLDRSTGLVWRRCRLGMVWDGNGCLGTPSTVSWELAMLTAAAEGWRLPNLKEVVSLMTKTGAGVRLDSRFFPSLLSDQHMVWTATHAGESTAWWDGGRIILARRVGLVAGWDYWHNTSGRVWTADGTETAYGREGAQVLLVRDR